MHDLRVKFFKLCNCVGADWIPHLVLALNDDARNCDLAGCKRAKLRMLVPTCEHHHFDPAFL